MMTPPHGPPHPPYLLSDDGAALVRELAKPDAFLSPRRVAAAGQALGFTDARTEAARRSAAQAGFLARD